MRLSIKRDDAIFCALARECSSSLVGQVSQGVLRLHTGASRFVFAGVSVVRALIAYFELFVHAHFREESVHGCWLSGRVRRLLLCDKGVGCPAWQVLDMYCWVEFRQYNVPKYCLPGCDWFWGLSAVHAAFGQALGRRFGGSHAPFCGTALVLRSQPVVKNLVL